MREFEKWKIETLGRSEASDKNVMSR